jgi:hypothetical protein
VNAEGKSEGLMSTYVDDLLVMAEENIVEEVLKTIDSVWECSEAEHLTMKTPLTFCGMKLVS